MKIFNIACGLLVILLVLLNITDALPYGGYGGGGYGGGEYGGGGYGDKGHGGVGYGDKGHGGHGGHEHGGKHYGGHGKDCGHEEKPPEKTLPPTDPPKTKATKKPIIIKPKPKF